MRTKVSLQLLRPLAEVEVLASPIPRTLSEAERALVAAARANDRWLEERGRYKWSSAREVERAEEELRTARLRAEAGDKTWPTVNQAHEYLEHCKRRRAEYEARDAAVHERLDRARGRYRELILADERARRVREAAR